MNLEKIALLIFIIFSFSCKSEKKPDIKFELPEILEKDVNVSAFYYNSNKIVIVSPNLVGINNFGDTLEFPNNVFNLKKDAFVDVISNYDSVFNINRRKLTGLKLEVDTSKNIIDTDFFDTFTYYKIPLYVINETNEIKFLTAVNTHVLVEQQALDVKGKWKNIEKISYFGCGYTYNFLSLNQCQFATILINKYVVGNYKTKLRCKFTNGNKIYYSNTYDGIINKSQIYDSIIE